MTTQEIIEVIKGLSVLELNDPDARRTAGTRS